MAASVVQAALIFAIIAVLLVLCSLLRLMPSNQKKRLTEEEIENIRIRKEAEREALLEERIQRLQRQKKKHTNNRMLITARKDKAITDAGTAEKLRDIKGRAEYGPAWDEGREGSMPLRELLRAIPDAELRTIKIEAANLVEAWKMNGARGGRPVPGTSHRQNSNSDPRFSTSRRSSEADMEAGFMPPAPPTSRISFSVQATGLSHPLPPAVPRR